MDKEELLQALRKLDEITLMELLEINSDNLVDNFLDKIEDNLDKLYAKAQDEEVGEE